MVRVPFPSNIDTKKRLNCSRRNARANGLLVFPLRTLWRRLMCRRRPERERGSYPTMEDHRLTRQRKRAKLTEASTPTVSKRPRHDVLEESPLLLPSSDSSEKIDVPSASDANSDPSASSTSVIGNNYHVFLSFRGPDTRKGFVDHLYHRLKDVCLKFHPNLVFRDDEDLPFGEDVAANLISAIEHSKVSIPVISENYAASEWCLRELIHIMECKESRGQIVLPVLYKVEPKDVKYLKGNVKKAFESRRHWSDEAVKQQGREALRKVADCRVFESEKFADGREGELVNKLVEIIMREQQHDFQPHLPANLVGIEDRVAEVMNLVDIACPDTRIIGIWGMGGIGKTTLATDIYNKLSKKFECRSFLMDIRETINRKSVEHVQSLLISDITRQPVEEVRDSMIGIGKIQSSCEGKKVLILLDDVDRQDHLHKLIGGCNFKSGSRIIITCRDMALLDSNYQRYELKEMNSNYSMLLFSRYAFEGGQPPTELKALSGEIVATTGGLPLALTVIGSLLKGKDKSIWTETLEKLGKMPHREVQEKLKLSYNALEDNEKEMFLDIACFFIGTDKRFATYTWKDLQLYPYSGLARMIELSLIKIDDKNLLRMHDQLRDLGRAIAFLENTEPLYWSRPWDEETKKLLRRKEKNENIKALRLDERGSREFIEQKSFTRMPNLKFLHLSAVGFVGDFEGSLSELRWLKWGRCPNSFEATNVQLEKLVTLNWGRCPNSFEATNVQLEKLVTLDLSKNYISENWRGWSSIEMERLKVLDLSCCSRLKSTPNLSLFKNLEMLILNNCVFLEEIDPSIGDVKCLVSLNLSMCHALRQIPSSIGKMEELIELDLSLTNIKELPESIGKLNKLKILRIFGSKIKRLPSSIGKLQGLQELDCTKCYDLKGQIHFDKGGLSSLKTLRLDFTNISGLPENLDQLSSLERLDLFECHELQSLPKPPVSLSYLRLTCRSNELPSLSYLKHLKQLSLICCGSLQSIPELPSCLRTLVVLYCPKVERLPKLSDLEFLSNLELLRCNGLKELDGLEGLKSLRVLNVSILRVFDDKLHPIRGLEKLGSLEVLDIAGRKHIQVLDLSKSEHLRRLVVNDCKSLVEIRCPSKFLKHFSRFGCESLKKLPDFLPPYYK